MSPLNTVDTSNPPRQHKGILFAAQVDGIRSRKDRTVGLTLSTQELTPEKAGELFGTNGHLVTCYLSVKEHITDTEKEIIDGVEAPTQGKTPSQRLANTALPLIHICPYPPLFTQFIHIQHPVFGSGI